MLIRGEKVIVDGDSAAFYGVQTKVINQAVKRNNDRFTKDFLFRLIREEKDQLVTNCDHLESLIFGRTVPHAFTEHGVIMAASVLSSPMAIIVPICGTIFKFYTQIQTEDFVY